MKNLVLRNPILRFKLGRKIEVFQGGGEPWAGYYTVGNWPKSKSSYKSKKTTLVSPSIKSSDVTVNIPKFSPENKEFVPLYKKDITHNWLEGLRNKYLKTTVIPQLLTRTQRNNIKATSKTTQKTPINWDTEFYDKFTKNLTGQQKAYLDNEGVDYSNAASMLEYLKSKNIDLGKNGVDARWGKDSINAWNLFVSNTNFGPTLPKNISTSVLTTVPKPIDNIKIENIPTQTYDRTGIREYLRNKGLNPYSFSGALRRALRMVMNGLGTDDDKLLVKGMNIFKQGEQLPSRNLVKRFKLLRKGL